MERYLTEHLHVPTSRIQLLLGFKEHTSPADPMILNPSRANIIAALLSIIDNPEILHGDNIIIFYSGHGSCYPFEGKGDRIEALCPIDRDTIGDNGKPVPDISDRELNTILTQISRGKGHCITVILDCCHSGSVSRGLPGAGARTASRTRCTTVQDMLLAGEKILGGYPGYRSILSKDWYPDMDSHVVLAACEARQLAMSKAVEGEDGAEEHIGIFTDSLVQALRSGYCTKETTYAELVRFLDQKSHQTPVVAGKRKDARIWYQG